jgi:hypothetical protein
MQAGLARKWIPLTELVVMVTALVPLSSLQGQRCTSCAALVTMVVVREILLEVQ